MSEVPQQKQKKKKEQNISWFSGEASTCCGINSVMFLFEINLSGIFIQEVVRNQNEVEIAIFLFLFDFHTIYFIK